MKASKVALMTGPGALPLTHRHYIALLACSALKCPTIAKTQVAIWPLSDMFFMEYTCLSFNIKFNKKTFRWRLFLEQGETPCGYKERLQHV